MTDDRRYRDDEIREIFDVAARAEDRDLPARTDGSGLTLEELRQIGREVGLDPDRVEEAARALDRRPARLPRGRYLGLPVSVGRVVELPRAPTDEEWELLVAELRATFGARGRVHSQGSLRDWSNGNLHALVEPTESGYRLRMGTRKGNAIPRILGGLFLAGVLLLVVLTGETGDLVEMLMLAALAAGMGGSAVLGLPRWAAEREEQMERIAERAKGLVGGGEASD